MTLFPNNSTTQNQPETLRNIQNQSESIRFGQCMNNKIESEITFTTIFAILQSAGFGWHWMILGMTLFWVD